MKQARIDGSLIARMLSVIAGTGRDGADVAVVGSMNADYTVEVETMPEPGETILAGPMVIYPGGKSANQASSCARLGQRTHMLGAVGSDSNADMLVGKLSAAGVDVSDIEHVQGPSGSTMIVVDVHGENFVVVSRGSNERVTPEYVRQHRGVIQSAAVLGLCLESPLPTVTEAAMIASPCDTQVVLNISPMPPAENTDELEQLIRYVDIVIMNEHETSQFLGLDTAIGLDDDWDVIRRRLAAKGLDQVIVTLGAAGSMVLRSAGVSNDRRVTVEADEVVHIPAFKVTPVDTTGAGDSFMGSVLAGLAHGNTLVDSCLLASVVSAYSTSGKGAQSSYGDAHQVLDFLNRRGA